MNVPNFLTVLRVVFAIVVFACIAIGHFDCALIFFVLAALTDFVDGWWARKFKQITVFGRIMDPFADKFLICGVFICLVAVPELTRPGDLPIWLTLQPWMVVVIIGRELLITSLRAVVEQSGGDFSAKWIGKWKMVFQCVAIIACFVYLSAIQSPDSPFVQLFFFLFPPVNGPYVPISLFVGLYLIWLLFLWATVIITIYSGVSYCVNAVKMLRKGGESAS